MRLLTTPSSSTWPLSLLLGPRCDAGCVALAEEVCKAPVAERPGRVVLHVERTKRWLRREVGGHYHAKDEL